MKNVVAIVQARMSSSRFPGKVLVPLAGKCALSRIIDTMYNVPNIDSVVVATTDNPADDAICKHSHGADFFRGDENDVLKRMYDCASLWKADIIVDVTSDCPLIDRDMITEMITVLDLQGLDYYSNVVERSWPDGFDVQVYTFDVLKFLHENVEPGPHRSHSGWNVLKYKDQFRIGFMRPPEKYRLYTDMKNWGMTLDTPKDAEMLDYLFEHIDGKGFDVFQIIDYVIANPEILEMNRAVKRKTPGMG